jgi:hypothetical protein
MTPQKRIQYDGETRDFEMTLDGEFIGYAATYADAERILDTLIYDRLTPNGEPDGEPDGDGPEGGAGVEVIQVAEIIETVTAVAATALANPDAVRWHNAIRKGRDWLKKQETIRWSARDTALFFPSSRGGIVYYSNGVCQCEAYTLTEKPKPCYHRAAAHLVRRALEAIAAEAETTDRELAA